MIRQSPLRLDRYFVDELSVSTRVLSTEREIEQLLPEDIDVSVDHYTAKKNENEVLCKLEIKLKETQKRVPYNFLIRLVGIFEINSKNISAHEKQSHIQYTVPSLLWSSAREILQSQMEKGPFPPSILPLVTFLPEVKKKRKNAKRIKR